MRHRVPLVSSMILMGMAVAAPAGVSVGDEAPKITAGAWYNLPGGMKKLTNDHLKGQIVMVEFWATW